jgi:hypothetical protein
VRENTPEMSLTTSWKITTAFGKKDAELETFLDEVDPLKLPILESKRTSLDTNHHYNHINGNNVPEASDRDLFVFNHLNYTGGDSLTEALKANFQEGSLLVVPDPQLEPIKFQSFSSPFQRDPYYCEKMTSIRVICDHHLFLPSIILGRSVRKFTILRHPVVRLFSCYFQLVQAREKLPNNTPKSILERKGLEYFLDEINDTDQWPGGLKPLHYFQDIKTNDGKVRRIEDPELINKHIDKTYEFIGINELYDQSLFVLSLKMGTPNLLTWGWNARSRRPHISNMRRKLIEKAEKITELDYLLYERKRLEFKEKYGEEIQYFNKNILSLQERLTHQTNDFFDRGPGLWSASKCNGEDHGILH